MQYSSYLQFLRTIQHFSAPLLFTNNPSVHLGRRSVALCLHRSLKHSPPGQFRSTLGLPTLTWKNRIVPYLETKTQVQYLSETEFLKKSMELMNDGCTKYLGKNYSWPSPALWPNCWGECDDTDSSSCHCFCCFHLWKRFQKTRGNRCPQVSDTTDSLPWGNNMGKSRANKI